jgi:transposase
LIFAGVDWAESSHDVHVQDEQGRRLAAGKLADGVEGIARFHDLVAAHAGDPGEVVIGIETDRGLFVAALVAAGYQVFAVNPMSVSRYRDRHSSSGAKSDPGDAKVLADLVRTDRHNHRPAAPDSDLAEAVKVLARAHQSMIWNRRRQVNQLRSALREFYPAALAALDDLTSGDATAVLQAAPEPRLGAGLSKTQIAAALRRGGRTRRIDQRAAVIQEALRAPQLQPAPLVAAAMGAAVASLAAVIAEMSRQITVLEQQLTADFEQHPDAEVIRSLPGLGTILGARVPGEFATCRTATSTPSLAGITPAPHPSPALRVPAGPYWPGTSATSGSPTRSTCGRSPRSASVPEPGRSTTTAALPATTTTRPCEPSATTSSASSTDASSNTPSTTRTPPGPTVPRPRSKPPLDSQSRGMSNLPGAEPA